ncbi:MAG: hypothetical protein K8R91_04350, partial [Phycisphaerae bacterium]|nr:hypothetical protein [Phycisphaerae bacterium]
MLILLVTAVPAGGAARYWDNGWGDNNWFDGANWTGFGDPAANHDLVVNGKYRPVADGSSWTTDNGGSVTLQGTGIGEIPTVIFNNGLTFGSSGVGNLSITRGTVNSLSGTYFGYGSGSSGVANISGGYSILDVGVLYVGRYGDGTINLSSGGTVDSGTTYLGYYSGSNVGTISASGADTLLSTGSISVGYNGEGILRVRANASAESTTAYIGRKSGSEGLVSIGNTSDMTGGQWTTSGTLYLGYEGTGSMTMAPGLLYGEGSVVTNQAVIMGYASGGIGTASASGSGTHWTSIGNATVGRLGEGTVTIGNGALMEARSDMIIGDSTGSTGDVEVSGSGSTLGVSGTMAVGKWGEGTLTVQDGGDAQTGNLYIATSAGSGLGGDGEVHVSGTGSTLSTANINLGGMVSGASALLRIDQGSVQAGGDVNLRDGSSVVVYRGGLDVDGDISMESSGTRDLTVTAGSLSAGGVHLDWDDFVFETGSYLNVYGNRSGSGELSRTAGGGGAMSFSGGGRVRLSDGANLSDTGDLNMQLTDLSVLENSTVNVDGEITLGTGVDFMGRSGSTITASSLTLGGGGGVSMLLDTNATMNVINDMVIADQSGAALSTVDVKSTAELNVGGLLTIAKSDSANMDINGTVTSTSGKIADDIGTDATVNIAGSAACWTMSGELTAEHYGAVWETISDGEEVYNQAGYLDRYEGKGNNDSHLFVEDRGS